jgi:ribosome maturation protein Sdo1
LTWGLSYFGDIEMDLAADAIMESGNVENRTDEEFEKMQEEEKKEMARGIKRNFFMCEMDKMCRYAMAF